MHLTSHLYGSHSSILRIFLSLLHQLWCSIYICNEYQMPHWSSVALILKCHEFKQQNHAEEISCTKTWWCFHFQSCHTLNTTWFSYEHSFLALYLLHLSVLLALRGFFEFSLVVRGLQKMLEFPRKINLYHLQLLYSISIQVIFYWNN